MCALALLCAGCSETQAEPTPPPDTEPQQAQTQPIAPNGDYLSAAATDDGFLAVGTGGRVDKISADSQVEHLDAGIRTDLYHVWSGDGETLICGAAGTLLRSTDGAHFTQVDVGTQLDLFSVARYQGQYYVGSVDGILFCSQDGVSWNQEQTQAEGDLISVVETNRCVAAISADTDILIKMDGGSWEYGNFNEKYEGLYPPYVFTKAVSARDTFFVAGYHRDMPGRPLVMYTETGEVWIEKSLTVFNGEELPEEGLRLNDLGFSIDQIVGACDGGKVAAITECASCHELKALEGAGDILAVAVRDDGVLLCGRDLYFRIMDSRQIRQDKIKAEQAWTDVEYYDARLIDVREEAERQTDGYIPGSIHIPLAEIADRLPQEVPDPETELIFYCAVGGRAQAALEQALEMGYARVYNLGGLSDWPYEIIIDEPLA